jgi:hypothetical protein
MVQSQFGATQLRGESYLIRGCNTPKKPHHSKVENSIIKNKEFGFKKSPSG